MEKKLKTVQKKVKEQKNDPKYRDASNELEKKLDSAKVKIAYISQSIENKGAHNYTTNLNLIESIIFPIDTKFIDF